MSFNLSQFISGKNATDKDGNEYKFNRIIMGVGLNPTYTLHVIRFNQHGLRDYELDVFGVEVDSPAIKHRDRVQLVKMVE